MLDSEARRRNDAPFFITVHFYPAGSPAFGKFVAPAAQNGTFQRTGGTAQHISCLFNREPGARYFVSPAVFSHLVDNFMLGLSRVVRFIFMQAFGLVFGLAFGVLRFFASRRGLL